jgi:hypothetical protein
MTSSTTGVLIIEKQQNSLLFPLRKIICLHSGSGEEIRPELSHPVRGFRKGQRLQTARAL